MAGDVHYMYTDPTKAWNVDWIYRYPYKNHDYPGVPWKEYWPSPKPNYPYTPPPPPPDNKLTGWICPKCDACISPIQITCPKCDKNVATKSC